MYNKFLTTGETPTFEHEILARRPYTKGPDPMKGEEVGEI
jgi:hypothetical protein